MISRRRLLLGFSGLVSAAALAPKAAMASHTGTTIGAIRWDPWYILADTAERPLVEASLGQPAWQQRGPSCAVIPNTYSESMSACGTQAKIDSEITVAAGAGLDYWAYCWYGATDPMMQGWRFHQSSAIASKVNWCAIFYSYAFFVSEVANNVSAYTAYFQQGNYQKVISGRPLIYLISDTTATATLAASISSLRSACSSAGAGNPYIVLMSGSVSVVVSGIVASTGADAIADYSYAPKVLAGTYASLVSSAETEWATLAATSQAMVPLAMTGWDRRPRIERPVSYEVPGQLPFLGESIYYQAGTPAAIAAHVSDLITWIKAHASNCPSASGLIYSWDEHDEGGSTLNPSLGTGNAIISAVAGSL